MRLFLQILFFIFTCFTSSVLTIDIGTAPKIVVPTNTSIFQKTEKTIHSEKAKIGLEIPKAFGIGRSSIASLSGSYLQDDYPDLANVLNITSSILAITDLSANGVDILLKANTNPSAAIDIISESEDVLDATAHIEHVEVLLDRITAPSPDPQVMAVLNSSNPKTKDFLVDILEAEKHSAKGADRMDIVNKIDEAIEVVNSAGITAKYPINNFLDFVNSNFTASQKQLFNKAQDFYSSFNPSFNVNELRGIDFDLPITNVIKQEDNVMYQMVTIDPITGNPRFGSYFFENIDEDVTKLGIGDINRIKADGRVKVKIILDGEVDFLKSKTANIEDWTGSGNIFEGGGNQFYNPTAKTKIKSFEIIQTY